MNYKHKYPVVDIFQSLQGEGLRQGRQTLFIRFFGCNLKCSFCDEPHHLNASKVVEFTAQQLISFCVTQFPQIFYIPRSAVCLTGGEPLIHNIVPFVDLCLKEGCLVQIETNGTQEMPLSPGLRTFVHTTVAPKESCDFHIHESLWFFIDEIKLVCNAKNGESIVNFFLESHRENIEALDIPIFIQPENNQNDIHEENSKRCIELANDYCLHFSPQLHKILKVA